MEEESYSRDKFHATNFGTDGSSETRNVTLYVAPVNLYEERSFRDASVSSRCHPYDIILASWETMNPPLGENSLENLVPSVLLRCRAGPATDLEDCLSHPTSVTMADFFP